MKCAAWTDGSGIYPQYVNLTRDGDEMVVTVRSEPRKVEGIRLCGQTCKPGGEHCNNYCNLAPDKGPMQDSPERHVVTLCGDTAVARVPLLVWQQMVGGA